MVQIRSNVRSPPINDNKITVKDALRLKGKITCRNATQVPPSSLAASKYSTGIDKMPAMNITIAKPIPFHTSTSATENNASLGFPNQSGVGSPIEPRVVLMSPIDGCISVE